MAYRRSLTTSARLVTRQRFAPSFSCTHHQDDCKNWQSDEKVKSFPQSRSYGCVGNNTNICLGLGGMTFRDPKWSQFLHAPMTTSGFLLARNMSTTNGEEKIECMSDMTNVLADKTMEVVSSQVSEVAVAAADSWLPVAVLQYAIDGIHIYTGLNWWASIVITTLVYRTLSIPITINQLKINSKLRSFIQEAQQITQDMQDRGWSPTDVAECRERTKRLFKEHGFSYFTFLTLFKSLSIRGPVSVCFFLAILNMVEKVPSLQTGGIAWFIDLTTTDSFYILPFLAAFPFWLNVEFSKREGPIRDPAAAVRMKNVFRGLSALMFLLAACFPNALLCYWIPSSFFTLVFGQITKRPSVKKLLNIPIIEQPPPPSPTNGLRLDSTMEDLIKSVKQRESGKRRYITITNQSIILASLLSQKPQKPRSMAENPPNNPPSIEQQLVNEIVNLNNNIGQLLAFEESKQKVREMRILMKDTSHLTGQEAEMALAMKDAIKKKWNI